MSENSFEISEELDKKEFQHGGARDGAGRPEFEPTEQERKQVEAMSGYGVPVVQIAAMIRGGIAYETLKKHFGKELVVGKGKANSRIGQTIYQKAAGGDTAALIWWSKTQMDWSETQKHELSAGEGFLGLANALTSLAKEREKDTGE